MDLYGKEESQRMTEKIKELIEELNTEASKAGVNLTAVVERIGKGVGLEYHLENIQ